MKYTCTRCKIEYNLPETAQLHAEIVHGPQSWRSVFQPVPVIEDVEDDDVDEDDVEEENDG